MLGEDGCEAGCCRGEWGFGDRLVAREIILSGCAPGEGGGSTLGPC
jgi:hypothetical protein